MLKNSISVAIAVYNGEKYIDKQLRSILNQTLPPDEIIICDDNSNDRTIYVINNVVNENAVYKKIVKIIKNQTNLGVKLNFEKAISLCSSEYIFISDQDDYWFKNKINYMVNVLKNSNKLIALNNCRLANQNLIPFKIKKIEQIEKIFLSAENFIPGCCVVFKKKIKDIYLPLPNHNQSYDGWLNFIANKTLNKIIVRKVFQLYRRHSNNDSQAEFNITKTINIFTLFRIRFKIFIKTLTSRKKQIENQKKNYEELLFRIQESKNFLIFNHSELLKEYINLKFREKIINHGYLMRFFYIFLHKNKLHIWNSEISKFLDFISIK
jgi:glycosyltransferase involved in cell wall biosynthesis